jgi:hypothetical protein
MSFMFLTCQNLSMLLHMTLLSDMSSCSTPVSEPDPDPTSSDQPTQKYVPYHHPHHKNQGMEIMLSYICRRDMKDIIVDQCRLPG